MFGSGTGVDGEVGEGEGIEVGLGDGVGVGGGGQIGGQGILQIFPTLGDAQKDFQDLD